MPKLTIDIWSDVMCPFCYLGDTVLAEAISEFEHGDSVELKYHSYQLMPELGQEPEDLSEIFAQRYGADQMKAQHEQLSTQGKAIGIEFNFEKSLAVNTRKAHELNHFAEAQGKGHEMMVKLFEAHFTDGINVADTGALVELAQSIGLDAEKAREALESDEYAELFDQDIKAAKDMGIQGVPFFVFIEKYALSGAQPKEMFVQALETSWAELV